MKRRIFTIFCTSLIGMLLYGQVPDPFMRFTFDVDGTDAMGNSYSILMTNASIIEDAVRGNVVEVKDTVDGYVELDPAAFSGVTDHTIACWYLSYDTVTQFQAAFQLIADDDNYIMLCAPTWKKFYQVHMMNGVGTYKCLADTLGPLTQEEWHHIAYTCDDGFFTLYRDGELVDTVSSQVTPAGIIADTACIGMNWQKDRDVSSHALIDDFEFYKSVLSPEQIQTLYNSAATGIGKDIIEEQNEPLFFYPNPVSEKLSVNSRGGELIITNVVGAVVSRQIIQPGTAEIHLGNIAPGIYLIRIEDGLSGNGAKKLIIR